MVEILLRHSGPILSIIRINSKASQHVISKRTRQCCWSCKMRKISCVNDIIKSFMCLSVGLLRNNQTKDETAR